MLRAHNKPLSTQKDPNLQRTLFDHNGIALETDRRQEKVTDIWKLDSIFPNNQWMEGRENSKGKLENILR